jgi:hypothetical protein
LLAFRVIAGEKLYFDYLIRVDIAVEKGFVRLDLCRSHQNEWKDFESRYAQKSDLAALPSGERNAFEQIQNWQRGYLRWGSDTKRAI